MPTEKKPIGILWPNEGRSDRAGHQTQPPLTTPSGTINVWPEGGSGRRRGGSRPALVRAFSGGDPAWSASSITGTALGIGQVSFVPSTSSRVLTYIVFLATTKLFLGQGDPEGTITDGPAILLSPSLYTVQSSEWNQKLYIAAHDLNQTSSETTYPPVIYDPVASSVSNWVATDGTIPYGSRCITTFRDRLVLAGGTTNPHGVFFSRQGDSLDWDYSATDEGGAVSLALAFAGGMGDTVTAIAPHADNCLILGGQSSLWMLIGDPKSGQLANLSTAIGIVDHYAYCTTPDGWFVFLSEDGLYAIPAGCGNPIPQSVSREKLPRELIGLGHMFETGVSVALAYDIFHRGIHIVVAGVAYWFLDWETKSFWQVRATDADGVNGIEPNLCRSVYTPHSMSNVLFTCTNPDAGVRRYNENYDVDDEVTPATARRFTSACIFGPFGDASLLDDSRWDELDIVLSSNSAAVDVEIFAGDTAEEAATAAESGTPAYSRRIGSGRSPRMHPRVRGTSLYLKLSSDRRWAFEAASAVLAKAGRVRV
jgi:hypothetical protein